MENDIEQRLVDPDAAVVFDKAELAKSIHEEADAGPGGANHFRQRSLCDLRNQRFPARLACRIPPSTGEFSPDAFHWS